SSFPKSCFNPKANQLPASTSPIPGGMICPEAHTGRKISKIPIHTFFISIYYYHHSENPIRHVIFFQKYKTCHDNLHPWIFFHFIFQTHHLTASWNNRRFQTFLLQPFFYVISPDERRVYTLSYADGSFSAGSSPSIGKRNFTDN